MLLDCVSFYLFIYFFNVFALINDIFFIWRFHTGRKTKFSIDCIKRTKQVELLHGGCVSSGKHYVFGHSEKEKKSIDHQLTRTLLCQNSNQHVVVALYVYWLKRNSRRHLHFDVSKRRGTIKFVKYRDGRRKIRIRRGNRP